MNKTKIEWTDYTWNPITGCTKGCEYCYARKISERFNRSFKPTFHIERIDEPYVVKKPSRIFADSMGDFFDKGVKREWQEVVLHKMVVSPQHIFILLTKVPENIPLDMVFPENCWVGVSVEGDALLHRWDTLKSKEYIWNKFISFEPLLSGIDECFWDKRYYGCSWVIVGGLTGRKPNVPLLEWVRSIHYNATFNRIPVFIKVNAGYNKLVQEYPKNEITEESK